MRRTIIVCHQVVSVVFSKSNRRISVLVIAGILVVVAVCAGVVSLEIASSRPGRSADNCGSISRLIIFGTNVVGFIGLLIKIEVTRKNVRHDVRGEIQPVLSAAELAATEAEKAKDHAAKVEEATNGNLAAAVQTVAKEVRAAEREQMVNDPRFWASMEATMRRLMREILEDERGKEKDRDNQ